MGARLVLYLSLLVAVVATGAVLLSGGKKTIGATAEVRELSTGLVFLARVDTGASVSSLHCEELVIEDASATASENIGKPVRVRIANKKGESGWLETEIVDYARIRSIDAANYRYFVRLRLSCVGVEREAIVSLSDRDHMKYKLLLGREFLGDRFVVDVDRDTYELY